MKFTFGIRSISGVVLLAACGFSHAQANNTIRIVVPFSPGGVTDQTARLLAERMSPALGQPIIIDNRPGGGSRIGVDVVAKAPADGMTLLFTNTSYSILPVVDPKVRFDPLKSLTPLTITAVYGLGIVVGNQVPVKTLGEFIAHAKKNPGKLTYGSAGPGSGAHFAGEYLKSLTGIELIHIPYKSTTSALNDLAGGVVDLAFDASPKPYVDSGRIKILAVTGDKRDPRFPNVPTAAESGVPKFVLTSWVGLFAPPGMAPAMVERISKAANAALGDPAFRKRIEETGLTPQGSTPEQFRQQLQTDLTTYQKIAADAKLKFE